MKRFDIIVIGGGQSGYFAAIQAASLGAKVCLVEKKSLGGTFLNSGLFVLRKFLQALGFYPFPSGHNFVSNEVQLDVQKVFEGAIALRQSYTEKWKTNLIEKGVHFQQGEGSFAGSKKIEIKSSHQTDLISAEKVILAVGSKPMHPDSIPFDEELIVSLDSLGEFRKLPKNVLIVDGGTHGVETASLLKVLGCKPFLCEQNTRMLEDEGAEIMEFYEEQVRKKRLKIILNKKILSLYKRDSGIDISLDGGIKFPISKIFFGGIRKPSSNTLNINTSNIRLGRNGEIFSDEKMETSLPGVFAVGSSTRNRRLANRNYEEAKVAVYNCLGKSRSLKLDKIPSIIYSDPQFATLGCNSENAHYKGYRAIGGSATIKGPNESGMITQKGLLRLTIDKETKKIIGVQVISQNASEIMSMMHLAFKKGLTLKDLSNISFGEGDLAEPIINASRKILKNLKTTC